MKISQRNYLKMKNLLLFAMAAFMCACQSTTNPMPDGQLGQSEQTIVMADANRWKVFVDPTEKMMRVSGTGKGAQTEGPLYAPFSEANFRAAAHHFLKTTGQTCDVAPGTLITETSYQFTYSCKEATKPIRYCLTETMCRKVSEQDVMADRSYVGAQPTKLKLSSFWVLVYDHPTEERFLIEVANKNSPDASHYRGPLFADAARARLRTLGEACPVQRRGKMISDHLAEFEYEC